MSNEQMSKFPALAERHWGVVGAGIKCIIGLIFGDKKVHFLEKSLAIFAAIYICDDANSVITTFV